MATTFVYRALEKMLKASSKKDVELREAIEPVLGEWGLGVRGSLVLLCCSCLLGRLTFGLHGAAATPRTSRHRSVSGPRLAPLCSLSLKVLQRWV